MNEDNQQASTTAASKSHQFDLRMLLLLVAAVASFFAASRAFRETASTHKEITQLRSLDNSLQVRDGSQFAFVYQTPIWEGERRCKVYLPPNNQYRLCIALESEFQKWPPEGATPVKTFELAPGEHEIRHQAYDDGPTRIYVYCDDKLLYDKTEKAGWLPPPIWENSGAPQTTVQREVEEPLQVWRAVGQHPKDKGGYLKRMRGLLLWIERRSTRE